ncbi:MAG TPA: hypothetical protein VEI02_14240 [Planctomycetota bacterium]|nr:hypothetical protein [Planctomycetota bacterium]
MMPRSCRCALSLFVAVYAASAQAPGRLVGREVFAFKDGFGLISLEGELPTGRDGAATYDRLPPAVLGTFWPSAAEGGPRLVSVSAAKRRVSVERTALDVREVLEANAGAEVYLTETGGARYLATLLPPPRRTSEELRRISPPDAPEALPAKGDFHWVRTADGVKTVPYARIVDVVFRADPKTSGVAEELRDAVTWNFDWGGAAPTPSVKVRLDYVQRGVRWQPSYRVRLGDDGMADVELTGVLVNDAVDLLDATVSFIAGAPRLDFGDQADATALDEALRRFAVDARHDAFSNRMLSNAGPAQIVMDDPQGAAALPSAPTAEGGPAEDLYLFTVRGVTVPKGGRYVAILATWRLPAKDVYVLDLPPTPPSELFRNDGRRQTAAIREALAPLAVHKIRLSNDGAHPLTTGPASFFKDGRLLGQGRLSYAARGASVDVPLAAAVNLKVRREDRQKGVEPRALVVGDDAYSRTTSEGELTLTNLVGKTIVVEATREVFGAIAAAPGAVVAQLDRADAWAYARDADRPWCGYDWPWWWSHVNGVGRATWTVELAPGEKRVLTSTWHYHWK